MPQTAANPTATWRTHLHPPDEFSGNAADWPTWKMRWERYYRTANLKQESEEHQIDALMLRLGEKAEDILLTFKFEAEADSKKYNVILQKFDEYHGSKQNKVFHRTRFVECKNYNFT